MKHMSLLCLGLVLASFGLAGCGPDIATACEDQEACLGGNDADVDACIAIMEGQIEIADDIGCGDEFDVMFECITPKLDCRSQTTGQQCAMSSDCNGPAVCSNGECTVKSYSADQDAQNACEAEINAYERCN